jgi:hypothetical protein
MDYKNKSEIAKENLLRAEAALKDYMEQNARHPEQHKQLAEAVKVARDEYVDQFERLFPKIQ